MSSDSAKLEETRSALQQVQQFDPVVLGRRDALGDMNFDEIIPASRKVIELLKRIPSEILIELPDNQLQKIMQSVNSTRKIFDDILNFDLQQENPSNTRANLIRNINNHYDIIFSSVHIWISYGVARTVDFNGLDLEARAIIKGMEDRSEKMEQAISEREKTVDDLEIKLRSALAEQGVTQQAKYFGEEADKHQSLSIDWGRSTARWASIVAIVAFASFFTHRIPWIAPINIPEAIQFIASKALLIGAFSFMLIRSARNYRAHKHNEVINRHKQNALLTFNALVEAGATTETRNTVLNHASAAIYSPPESGYVTPSLERGVSNTTLIEALPRTTSQFSETT